MQTHAESEFARYSAAEKGVSVDKVERGISSTVREGSAVYGVKPKELPNGRASAPTLVSALLTLSLWLAVLD
jgi:hypothetical protein